MLSCKSFCVRLITFRTTFVCVYIYIYIYIYIMNIYSAPYDGLVINSFRYFYLFKCIKLFLMRRWVEEVRKQFIHFRFDAVRLARIYNDLVISSLKSPNNYLLFVLTIFSPLDHNTNLFRVTRFIILYKKRNTDFN